MGMVAAVRRMAGWVFIAGRVNRARATLSSRLSRRPCAATVRLRIGAARVRAMLCASRAASGGQVRFFERQRQARRHARRFVMAYTVAFAITVLAVGAGTMAFGMLFEPHGAQDLLAGEPMAERWFALWPLGAVIAGVTALAIGVAAWSRARELVRGWRRVAQWFGGRPVPSTVDDPARRRLYNVVEEMAIAAGVPVPEVWVLERESGINGFACGHGVDQALIAVTRGALDQLDRDELQALVAHEFAHLVNGDMRYNLRMIGPLYGLALLVMIARLLIIGFERGDGGGRTHGVGLAWPAAVPLYVFGSIGMWVGRLLRAAALRQREYLADAQAVQYTRQTDGLLGVIAKASATRDAARLRSPWTEIASHMLFADGLGLAAWYSSHPAPLARARAVRPGVEPRDLRARALAGGVPGAALAPAQPVRRTASGPSMAAAAPAVVVAVAAGQAQANVTALPGAGASNRLPSSGEPSASTIAAAAALVAAPDTDLTRAVHDPAHAPAVLLALLLADAAEGTLQQRACIADGLGVDWLARTDAWSPAVRALATDAHLPLVQRALPAIAAVEPGFRRDWLACIDRMIAADGRVGVFEFALATLVRRHLRRHDAPAPALDHGTLRLGRAVAELGTLLAVLARAGHADAAQARAAWLRGMASALPMTTPRYEAPADWPAALDAALDTLDRLDATSKEIVVQAMQHTLLHDGRISPAERALARTIAMVLHVPVPLLDQAQP
jgi:Zn-dependent protease with chaperone function